jgi:uncharacterized protein (DUF1697 family)
MSATHIALLRGINVGKAKRIAMEELRGAVELAGGTDVRTLLNSGNVVFRATRTLTGVALQKVILSATGVDAMTIVLPVADLAEIIAQNPLGAVATDVSALLVYVPADAAALANLSQLATRDWSPEAFVVGPRAAYAWSPDGILNGTVFEHINKALRDRVTARNWATMTKLYAMALNVTE